MRTRYIIVGIVVAVLLIDAVLLYLGGPQATISMEISKWSRETPFIAFFGGFIAGHFWAQNG